MVKFGYMDDWRKLIQDANISDAIILYGVKVSLEAQYAERERCLKIADSIANGPWTDERIGARRVAEKIRSGE